MNNSKDMKIIFLGTPPFVDPIIEELDKNFNLVKVIRNPKQLTDDKIENIKNLNPDFFIVAAFGKILSKEFIEIPTQGTLNVHPSLLPEYRGPSPIQEVILNGDNKTGVSIIKLDEKLDHGEIYMQEDVEINDYETFQSLAEKSFGKSATMLTEIINNYDDTKPNIQDDSKATFTKLINKEDGFVDIKSPPKKEKLERMIHAYFPWPGTWTKYDLSEKEVIIKLLPNNMIQVEGKKSMTYKDFKNGYEKGEELLKQLNLD